MNQEMNRPILKYRNLILAMAIVALCCVALTVLNFIPQLDILFYHFDLYYVLSFFVSLLMFLLSLAVTIVLLMYVLKAKDNSKTKTVVAVLYGLLFAPSVLSAIWQILSPTFLKYSYGYATASTMVSVVTSILGASIPFVLVLVGIFVKGRARKILLIVAASLGLSRTFFGYVTNLSEYNYYYDYELLLNFTGFMSFVGFTALYVALLFRFGLNKWDEVEAPKS